jgi:hypothetical protein
MASRIERGRITAATRPPMIPFYLRYRLAWGHQFKTFTRGDGAQLSDAACTKSRCFAQKALP